jgi:uncharacterized RDD family membrane protein YckC
VSAESRGAVPETQEKAGFWIRVGAYLIDLVIFVLISIVVLIFTQDQLLLNVILQLIGLAYFLYFWSAAGGGQTIGMRVLNLRVIKTDGSGLTIPGALLRYVGWIIASIPLAIGLIWVAFDKDKQGWHDKIASTYVIRTR